MNPQFSAFIRVRIFLPLLCFLLILSSCTKSSVKNDAPLEIEGLTFEKSLPLKYAKIFRIDEYRPIESSDSDRAFASSVYRLITVADSDRYFLIPENAPLPKNLPPEITLIQYPVKKTYLCAGWQAGEAGDSAGMQFPDFAKYRTRAGREPGYT